MRWVRIPVVDPIKIKVKTKHLINSDIAFLFQGLLKYQHFLSHVCLEYYLKLLFNKEREHITSCQYLHETSYFLNMIIPVTNWLWDHADRHNRDLITITPQAMTWWFELVWHHLGVLLKLLRSMQNPSNNVHYVTLNLKYHGDKVQCRLNINACKLFIFNFKDFIFCLCLIVYEQCYVEFI